MPPVPKQTQEAAYHIWVGELGRLAIAPFGSEIVTAIDTSSLHFFQKNQVPTCMYPEQATEVRVPQPIIETMSCIQFVYTHNIDTWIKQPW